MRQRPESFRRRSEQTPFDFRFAGCLVPTSLGVVAGAKNATLWLLYGESALQLAPGLGRVTFQGPRSWVGSASQDGRFDLIVTTVLVGLMFAVFRRRLRDLERMKRV